MAILNEKMFYGSLQQLTDSITAPVYDGDTPANNIIYGGILELPKVAEIAFGMIFKATSTGTVKVKLELEQSNDQTTFDVPVDVAAISADWNGTGLLIKNVTPDVTQYARVKLTVLSGHNAEAAIDVTYNFVK
jgi:hypothetical protein